MTSALLRERQREIGDTDTQREGHEAMKTEIGSPSSGVLAATNHRREDETDCP